MKNIIENGAEILRDHVSGFHIYSLEEPRHLIFAGTSFAELTGYEEEALLSEDTDLYCGIIHPEDQARYSRALDALSRNEGSRVLEYRILCRDGSVRFLRDSFTAKRTREGLLEGYSVLTDVTDLCHEKQDLEMLNETLPCGFIRYTCEKHPRVTYINENMLRIMGFPQVQEGEMDYFELYKDNIFLMIPPEERSRLAYCLGKVTLEDPPTAGELTVTRCDGKPARLFGWVTRHMDENGNEEFFSVCMDITERYRHNKEKETRNYIQALTDVYDKIFEYDFSSNTVKCLYWQNAAGLRWVQNVPMQMDDATAKWIETTVHEQDRQRVSSYFKEFHQENLIRSGSRPMTITYRELGPENEIQLHTGIFLKIDSSTGLFCCRREQESEESSSLRSENESLKSMQEIVMRFSEGISAFEVKDRMVTPLYASDNVCEFFGYTREEWLPMMKKATSIKRLVSRCDVPYEEFMKLLEKGEAEYTYCDVETGAQRHIKAICSQKSPGTTSPFYVMLYNLDNEGQKAETPQRAPSRVYIRTFGYFDVFVDGKPIAFRNEKSKELFALLVDRRGGFITSEEAISFLWEEDAVDSVTLARYRKVALRLKNLLEEYGIADIVESVNGKRRLDVEKIQCDLYDYLTGKEEYSSLFKGSYLSNYSWGETTLAELLGSVM